MHSWLNHFCSFSLILALGKIKNINTFTDFAIIIFTICLLPFFKHILMYKENQKVDQPLICVY